MAKSGGLGEAFFNALAVIFLSLIVAVGIAFAVEPIRENRFLVLYVPVVLFLAEFVGRVLYDAYLR